MSRSTAYGRIIVNEHVYNTETRQAYNKVIETTYEDKLETTIIKKRDNYRTVKQTSTKIRTTTIVAYDNLGKEIEGSRVQKQEKYIKTKEVDQLLSLTFISSHWRNNGPVRKSESKPQSIKVGGDVNITDKMKQVGDLIDKAQWSSKGGDAFNTSVDQFMEEAWGGKKTLGGKISDHAVGIFGPYASLTKDILEVGAAFWIQNDIDLAPSSAVILYSNTYTYHPNNRYVHTQIPSHSSDGTFSLLDDPLFIKTMTGND